MCTPTRAQPAFSVGKMCQTKALPKFPLFLDHNQNESLHYFKSFQVTTILLNCNSLSPEKYCKFQQCVFITCCYRTIGKIEWLKIASSYYLIIVLGQEFRSGLDWLVLTQGGLQAVVRMLRDSEDWRIFQSSSLTGMKSVLAAGLARGLRHRHVNSAVYLLSSHKIRQLAYPREADIGQRTN